jgi:hypothetical protein
MSDTRDPDRDQPLPTPGRQPVQAVLIRALEERRDYGIRKYGRPLETHNGRDALTDAWEEALDLVTYLTQFRLERGDALPTAVLPAPDNQTAARAAVARVRALHQQYRFAGDDTSDYCAHCNQLSAAWIPWPCPTVTALDGELRRRAGEAGASTADKATALGMTPTDYRAHRHNEASESIRAAVKGLYAEVGLRVMDALDGARQDPAQHGTREPDPDSCDGCGHPEHPPQECPVTLYGERCACDEPVATAVARPGQLEEPQP